MQSRSSGDVIQHLCFIFPIWYTGIVWCTYPFCKALWSSSYLNALWLPSVGEHYLCNLMSSAKCTIFIVSRFKMISVSCKVVLRGEKVPLRPLIFLLTFLTPLPDTTQSLQLHRMNLPYCELLPGILSSHSTSWSSITSTLEFLLSHRTLKGTWGSSNGAWPASWCPS